MPTQTALVLLPLTAFGAALITFFSGFGLTTVLLPVLLLFVEPRVAVLLAASVHLLNNLLKVVLVGRHADWQVVLRFGLPAVGAALLGAALLHRLDTGQILYTVQFGAEPRGVSLIAAAMGTLILVFALWEGLPWGNRIGLPKRYLPLGGLLSGFFGGLSGHQGALRSAFLLPLKLSPQGFVATGVWIGTAVDVGRMSMYLSQASAEVWQKVPLPEFWASTVAAFVGSYLGSRFLRKTTLPFLQRLVATALVLLGLAMLLGQIG